MKIKAIILSTVLAFPMVANAFDNYQLVEDHPRLGNVMIPITNDKSFDDIEYYDCFVMTMSNSEEARVYVTDGSKEDNYIIETGMFFELGIDGMVKVMHHRDNKCSPE